MAHTRRREARARSGGAVDCGAWRRGDCPVSAVPWPC